MLLKKAIAIFSLLSLTSVAMEVGSDKEEWNDILVLNHSIDMSSFIETYSISKTTAGKNYLNYVLSNKEIEGISEKAGQKFPLCTAIVDKIRTASKGKKVLEIAGADGSLAMTLALLGAESVRICEIEENQEKLFNQKLKVMKEFVPEIKDQIQFDCGDYFEKYKKYPPQSFDVIVCQNLLHFLGKAQQEELVKSIHTLLTPQGKVFLSSNYFEPTIYFPGENTQNKKSWVQKFVSYNESLNGIHYITKIRQLNNSIELSDQEFNPEDFKMEVACEFSYDPKEKKYKFPILNKILSTSEQNAFKKHYQSLAKNKPAYGRYMKVTQKRPFINEKSYYDLFTQNGFKVHYFYFFDGRNFSLTKDPKVAHFIGVCAEKVEK